MKNLRNAERFEDFGRVESSELCLVSGVLEDISKTGIKVSYSIPPAVDMEKEYEITVRLSRVTDESLALMVKPVRVDNLENETCVGFIILHSKDSAKLENYIHRLKEDSNEEDDRIVPQTDNDSLFI